MDLGIDVGIEGHFRVRIIKKSRSQYQCIDHYSVLETKLTMFGYSEYEALTLYFWIGKKCIIFGHNIGIYSR